MQNFSLSTFKQDISGAKTLVDLWASWCGPCKMFMPIFEAASELHPDINFGKVNVDEEREIAAQFGVRSIPTLLAFKNGELVAAKSGALDPAGLEEFIKEIF